MRRCQSTSRSQNYLVRRRKLPGKWAGARFGESKFGLKGAGIKNDWRRQCPAVAIQSPDGFDYDDSHRDPLSICLC